MLLSEGTGKTRERPRPAPQARVRRHRPTTCASCAGRSTSTCRRSVRAGIGRTGAARPRPAPHAAPRHAHGRDHDARPPRPAAAHAAAAAADRRLRLPARAHAGLPALRVGGAVRDVHVRDAAHARDAPAALARLDTALADVSAVVEDADGGTRIGPALHEFVATPRYADRARGALTIVLSDGLERGDPALMVARRGAPLAPVAPLLWWSPLALHPEYDRSRAAWRRSSTTSSWPARATSRPCWKGCVTCERIRRRPSPHLARAGPAVAERADDPAHLRALRIAAAARLPRRRVRRRGGRARLHAVGLHAGQLAARPLRGRGQVGAVAARGDGLAERDRRLRGPVQPARDARRSTRRPPPRR